jgi:hypothetical protein
VDQTNPWISRIWREFEAGNLTRAARDVLRELGRFRHCAFGLVPSHALLAARARCNVRTVQRALETARNLGLVDWAHRHIKAGWRKLRTSNRYQLLVPTKLVRTNRQKVRGVTYVKKTRGIEAVLAAAAGGIDLLKRRREQMEARFRVAAGVPAVPA